MTQVENGFYPSADEFLLYAKTNKVIPVVKVIDGDMETPISLFVKLKNSENCFLLESAKIDGRLDRYSIIGRNPYLTIKVENEKVIVTDKNSVTEMTQNPYEVFNQIIEKYHCEQYQYAPRYFCGLTGYLGYDMIKYSEDLELAAENELEIPDCMMSVPKEVIVYDHLKQKIYIIINCFFDEKVGGLTLSNFTNSITLIDIIEHEIINRKVSQKKHQNKVIKDQNFESNITKEKFMENVNQAKNYIYEGDIFQVVLSQRLKANLGGTGFDFYRRLRNINPSPYMFYLDFDQFSIAGTSPEMLVKVSDKVVETVPIAGTRKRGINKEEDDRLEKELLSDQKERAEHLMLVDLGRNDIGKVSAFDTVKVKNLMHVQKFSHVMHIVSNVEGKLSDRLTVIDALKSVMPAGTVSGAPKIRAMEIIDELETTKRGVYSGAVGYIGFDGEMDTCITIRTAVIKEGHVYMQAGAGIVADSIPEKEYEETLSKAAALLKAI
ncbi:MAG: anthranilate synthase component I [Clostridia bacterium]|nr:anthranilate synthase component I [Clostridia bacterium]